MTGRATLFAQGDQISSSWRACFLGLLYLCCFGAHVAAATELTGSLTDPQNQSVAAATVRLLRRADSTQREIKTDGQGRFSFLNLDGGEYRLTAESPGFALLTRSLAVQPNGQQTETLQFSTLAAQNQSITVTGNVFRCMCV